MPSCRETFHAVLAVFLAVGTSSVFAQSFAGDVGVISIGEDTCDLGDYRKGVCIPRSECQSATSLLARGFEPVVCRIEGDITYVCCETDAPRDSSQLPRGSTQYHEEQHPPRSTQDSDEPEADDSEDPTDRFHHYHDSKRVRGFRNPSIISRPPENGQKYHHSYNGISDNGRGTRPQSTNKPYWLHHEDDSDVYYFSSDKDTYNPNQPNWSVTKKPPSVYESGWSSSEQNYRPQKPIDWSVPGENSRPQYPTKRPSQVHRPGPQYSSGWSNGGQGNRPQYPNEWPQYNQQQYQNNNNYNNHNNNNYNNYNNHNNNNNNNRWPDSNRHPGDRYTTQRPRTTTTKKYTSNYGSHYKPESSWPQSNNNGGRRKRISEIKCEEYSQFVTETVSGLPLVPNPEPITVRVPKCYDAQVLIVGGQNTTIGEFPHMAALGYTRRNQQGIGWLCGGSLISDQYVLTAAHCVVTSAGKPVKVRLGEYNLEKDNDGANPEDYSIDDVIKHPEYKPPSKYNDIALLKLSRKVRLREDIRPACLHQTKEIPEKTVTAVGWGQIGRDDKQSDVLLKVSLDVIRRTACNNAYSSHTGKASLSRGIDDTQVCAGKLSGGKDTCQGDSGGPIEITSRNNRCIHHIVGLTSFGKACAAAESPGVYTRVSAYLSWIESIVWQD